MTDEIVVAISALEHFEYCPRQCALIHVDGVWAENEHTERGHAGHRRVDDNNASRIERGRQVLRGIPLWSERLGLMGRADAVEVLADGTMVPVEYKMGVRHGCAADVQLCAQALCLEEMMGTAIPHGFLWLSGIRRKQKVVLDSSLRAYTERAIESVRQQHLDRKLPIAVNDARCSQCQLLSHCLPGVVSSGSAVDAYVEQEVYSCSS